MLEVIGKGWSFAMLTARLCNPGVRRKRAKVAITSAIKFQGMTIVLGTVAISVPGMGTPLYHSLRIEPEDLPIGKLMLLM